MQNTKKSNEIKITFICVTVNIKINESAKVLVFLCEIQNILIELRIFDESNNREIKSKS